MAYPQPTRAQPDPQAREVAHLQAARQRLQTARESWQKRLISDLSLPVHDGFLELIVKIGRYLATRSKMWTLALGIAMVGAIGELDLLTGPEIGFSIFYLFPIAFISCAAGRAAGVMLSVLSAGLWFAADMAGGQTYSSLATPYWNAGVRLGFFLIVTHMLGALSVSLEWARTDYLTGLANARGFHDLATRALHQAQRSGRMLRAAAAGSGWTVTFSVGLATFEKSSESISESLAQADALMYAAKHAGKNTISHRLVEGRPL